MSARDEKDEEKTATSTENGKDEDMKTQTKKSKKVSKKAAPVTGTRKGVSVKKAKEVKTQPDRKIIKGVTALKLTREGAEIAVKAGCFVYDAGKGYGVWDPKVQKRILWISKERVTKLEKD